MKSKKNKIKLFTSLAIALAASIVVSCTPIILKGSGTIRDYSAIEKYIVKQGLFLQNWEGNQLPINHKQEWLDMTNGNLTWFYINDPIQISVVSETAIRIKSFALYPVSNMKVWMELRGYPYKILVLTIPEVIPLSVTEYTVPVCTESNIYVTEHGNYVEVPKIETLSDGMAEFSITSNDTWYKKIRSIKANWRCQFGTYGVNTNTMQQGGHESWTGITPFYAREWIAAITNWAYLCSSDTMKMVLSTKHYKKLYGVEFHPSTKNFLDTDEKYNDWYYNTLLHYNGTINGKTYSNSHKDNNLGILRGGNGVLGLGGGATFGIHCGCFSDLYYGAGYANVIVHEFGHCIGQAHGDSTGNGGSMPYGEFEGGGTRLWQIFSRLGLFPYSDDEVTGINDPKNSPAKVPYARDYFWNAKSTDAKSPFEIKGWGYGQSSRNPRKRLNQEELYMLNNPKDFPEVVPALRHYILWHPNDFSSVEYRWREGGTGRNASDGTADDFAGGNPALDNVPVVDENIFFECGVEND